MHVDGTIPFNDYLTFILLFQILFRRKKMAFFKPFSSENNKISKSLSFCFVVFAIVIYINGLNSSILKEGYLTSVLSRILAALTLIATCINVFYIIRLVINDISYRDLIYKAIVTSALILSFSVLFTQQLYSFGLLITEYSVETGRSSGLFSGGDCNGLAGFLCLIVSFLFVKMRLCKEKLNIQKTMIILLFVITIFSTASRMGFLTLVGLVAYYILFLQSKNTVGRNVFFTIVIVIIVIVSSDSVLSLVLERMNEGTAIKDEVISGEEGRSAIWMLYFNYMLAADIHTVLFGSNKSIFYLVPHNFFINTFFLNGILVTVIFIYSMIKTIMIFISQRCTKYIMPLAVTTIISLMFLTTGLLLYYYILICSLAWSYFDKIKNY